jgi:hypothetical protein
LEDSRSFLKPNCFTANRNIKTPVHLEFIESSWKVHSML